MTSNMSRAAYAAAPVPLAGGAGGAATRRRAGGRGRAGERSGSGRAGASASSYSSPAPAGDGQQAPGPGEQPQGQGSAGGGRAVLQPLERVFCQVAPTRADGCLHQVGQCLGADERGVIAVRRVQARHGGAVVAETDLQHAEPVRGEGRLTGGAPAGASRATAAAVARASVSRPLRTRPGSVCAPVGGTTAGLPVTSASSCASALGRPCCGQPAAGRVHEGAAEGEYAGQPCQRAARRGHGRYSEH